MNSQLQVHVTTEPLEMLRHPPAQFAHMGVSYCPIRIQIGSTDFPGPGWCDFAGVLLLRWHREVWKMSADESRAARLIFFDTPHEIWVRKTKSRWWKVSCITREGKSNRIGTEVLCVPEAIEAALLSASQRLLAGYRKAGVWPNDVAELALFLESQAGQHSIA